MCSVINENDHYFFYEGDSVVPRRFNTFTEAKEKAGEVNIVFRFYAGAVIPLYNYNANAVTMLRVCGDLYQFSHCGVEYILNIVQVDKSGSAIKLHKFGYDKFEPVDFRDIPTEVLYTIGCIVNGIAQGAVYENSIH